MRRKNGEPDMLRKYLICNKKKAGTQETIIQTDKTQGLTLYKSENIK